MCGIVALLAREQAPQVDALAPALDALAPRGPDGHGSYRSPSGRVILGHTLLAIMAPQNGAQPVANEDSTVTAVVNGELYDYARLRKSLEARGHRFRTESDSELLVHLYEDDDRAFVHQLRGEFAFVLWDESKQRLIAGRDRFGIKPLVYSEQSAGLWLASEAKALFAAGIRAAWDEQAFAHALSHQYLPPSRTLFRAVRQLPPGHLLLCQAGSTPRIERYWDLDLPVREHACNEAEAVARVREHLGEAVRLRLHAATPVAFHLSGGIDSAAILALAARHSGTTPLHAFGVSFQHEPYGEEALAQQTAEALGATFHPVPVSQEQLLEALSDAVYAGEGLCINGQLPAKLLLARAIRARGFKVALSGEGADEALLGYAHLAHDLLDSHEQRAALGRLDPAQRGIMLPMEQSPDLGVVRDTLGFVPTFLQAKGALGDTLLSLVHADQSPTQVRDAAFARLFAELDHEGQLKDRPPVLQSVYLWTRLALANYILRTLGDGTEMAASLEGRTPFLDHVFFEQARDVPVSLKIRGNIQKHVLREAVRDLLPSAVVERRKHPFLAPPITSFGSSRMREQVLDGLSCRALTSLPLLDPVKVRHYAEQSFASDPSEAVRREPVVMTALSACHLQERFKLES